MPEGDELLRFARAKERWKFKATPPFHIEPPIKDAKQLARLFTGRRAELSRVILPLYNGRNILVRGMLGVGKSAFILWVLHELDAQAKTAKDRLLPIYIYHFYGGTTDDFCRFILFALAQVLADKDEEAKSVLEVLRGVKVTASRSRGIGVNAQITPQMRAVLTVAKNYGGFSPEMPDEALDKLGFTTFVELMPLADYLVANDLMVRQEYEGGVRYIVSDMAAKVGEE